MQTIHQQALGSPAGPENGNWLFKYALPLFVGGLLVLQAAVFNFVFMKLKIDEAWMGYFLVTFSGTAFSICLWAPSRLKAYKAHNFTYWLLLSSFYCLCCILSFFGLVLAGMLQIIE